MLSNNDIIQGYAAITRIDKYLVQELESGDLRTLINNSVFITNQIRKIMQSNQLGLDKLINRILASDDIEVILREARRLLSSAELRELISIAPETLTGLTQELKEVSNNLPVVNNSVKQTNSSVKSVNKTIARTDSSIRQANETINETTQILPDVNQNLSDTNALLSSTKCSLDYTNMTLSDLNAKIPQIPPDLLQNANNAVIRYDCIGKALSQSVSQRFLILRLLFGNPASSFENCVQPDAEFCKIKEK
ncbi:MAG: hypothetical protein MZV64_27380 [Ignavibacteriales bacterium]|nr:hypothetical protein [Ignavibacteriales bacterium]